MQTFYYIENVCVSSELYDLKNRLLKHVYEKSEITDEVKEKLEQEFRETTDEKTRSLHDEIDLRYELGQFIHS